MISMGDPTSAPRAATPTPAATAHAAGEVFTVAYPVQRPTPSADPLAVAFGSQTEIPARGRSLAAELGVRLVTFHADASVDEMVAELQAAGGVDVIVGIFDHAVAVARRLAPRLKLVQGAPR
jgi:hypothetical protein